MNHRTTMKSTRLYREFSRPIYALAVALLSLPVLGALWHTCAATTVTPRTFPTPQAAADALLDAAEKFDVPALEQVLGPGGDEIIHTGEPARDREIAKQFAEQARTKMEVSVDPGSKTKAIISVGSDRWPFPVPIVKSGNTWSFD